MTRKEHWDTVYQTKEPNQVSWTQDVPQTSLNFINECNVSKSASVIDIGGGDSRLVDHLLNEGFEDITVLDISGAAIERAKLRLGERATKVRWIASDILEFTPTRSYDIWHDRATFHFLTTPVSIEHYVKVAHQSTNDFLTLGTFSVDGPEKCSGLEVSRYDETLMERVFEGRFERIKCITEDHTTPFGTTQNFLFCSFRKC